MNLQTTYMLKYLQTVIIFENSEVLSKRNLDSRHKLLVKSLLCLYLYRRFSLVDQQTPGKSDNYGFFIGGSKGLCVMLHEQCHQRSFLFLKKVIFFITIMVKKISLREDFYI